MISHYIYFGGSQEVPQAKLRDVLRGRCARSSACPPKMSHRVDSPAFAVPRPGPLGIHDADKHCRVRCPSPVTNYDDMIIRVRGRARCMRYGEWNVVYGIDEINKSISTFTFHLSQIESMPKGPYRSLSLSKPHLFYVYKIYR